MLFNSLEFLVFLPVVAVLHFALPHRYRWILLLVASYVFYMAWEPAYGLLLLGSTALDFFVSNALPRQPTPERRRALLLLSLSLSLGLLFTFKYYNLMNDTLHAGADALGMTWPLPRSNLVLPVGISFYTFQTIAYTVDVYRGRIQPERHFGIFALYVAYFPQLVAGPIERAEALLPQLHRETAVDWDRIASGLRLAAWGLFKKVVVADRLAIVVNQVYDDPRGYSGFALLLASFFFAWQVYCDFSGYSDIAIGVARIFGVDLMKNFDQPHGSRSFKEIWSRWHISLSTWFRDYLYIPLGGNRVGVPRWAFNTMLVFVISGLWHGATWAFVVWGFMHGFFLVFGELTAPARNRIAEATGFARYPRARLAWQVGSTFCLWVLTLVFFRANSLSDAVYICTHVHVGWSNFGSPVALFVLLERLGLDVVMFAYCLAIIPLTEFVDWSRRQESMQRWWADLSTPARWALDQGMVFGVIALGNFSDVPFVYFQF